MLFKYRVKGKVNNRFVLRGLLFNIGFPIDFCVSESELDFVKAHIDVKEIIDLDPVQTIVEIPEPIHEEIIEKEEKDELQLSRKTASRPNKAKSKAKV